MSGTTIPRLVDAAAERFGDHEAFVDGDQRWTYAEYRDRIHAAARALMARGIQPGDCVAVWAPNTAEWAVAALGVHCAGATLIPINTRFKGREAGDLLDRTSAKLLFTVTDFLDTDYVALLNDAGAGRGLEETIILRGTIPEGCTSWDGFLEAASTVDDADRADRSAAVDPDDRCHVMFTSGTTGAPKGAMLRHGAVCRAFASWSEVIGLRQDDRYLVVNPFFHAFGLNSGILACLLTGATLIPHPVFDVPAVMARVVEERISMLPGPPAIYQTILNHPDLADLDLSSLRLAVTGAAPVPVPLIHAMRDTLGFETVITGYGLTEASGIATMCRHDDPPEVISGSSGRAIDDVEVLVVDADGDEMPRGEPGEVVVRGYNVMVGYLDDPDQTAEAVDADGWLHTGDIARVDENGYVWIVDRKKELIKYSGFQVPPAELEGLLLEHHGVADCAVIAKPDEQSGEIPKAFVVRAKGSSVDDEELIAFVAERVATFKQVREVEFIDAIPKNPSGKILRRVLVEQERAKD